MTRDDDDNDDDDHNDNGDDDDGDELYCAREFSIFINDFVIKINNNR